MLAFRCSFLAVPLCFAVSHSFASEPPMAAFESPVSLKASEYLPQELLSSQLYEIDETIANNGLTNDYRVTSASGEFTAHTTVGLYKLIAEIHALELMREIEKSESYQSALKEAGVDFAEGLKNLAIHPADSVTTAGKGVAALFYRGGESLFDSGTAETEDHRAKQLIGFSKTKRAIAAQFNVDVYSTNPVLQQHLNNMAWAEFAGGFTFDLALMPIGGAAGIVRSTSGAVQLLNEAVATQPPSELKRQNRRKLEALGLNPNVVDLFIDNPYLSPRQQTYIAAAADVMSEVNSREVMLLVAIQVQDADMALDITTSAMMYASYDRNVRNILELYPAARVIGGRDQRDVPVLLVPADYLTWNPMLLTAVNAIDEKSGRKGGDVWLLGQASEAAHEAMERRGWKIQERAYDLIGLTRTGLLTTSEPAAQ